MSPEIPQLLLILKEACEEFGYSWKLLDTYSNNLVEVSNGNKSFFASNGKISVYPLNQEFAAQLVNDKAWSYRILKQKGYRVPKGEYFFLKKELKRLRGEGREIKDAIVFARGNYPLFIKPNNGSLGILAEIVNNEEELRNHLERIKEISWIAIIQKVIHLPEYRIFTVDGEIEFVYQRLAAKIVGDGKRSVGEFINQINRRIKRKVNKLSRDSFFLRHQLQKHSLSFASILNLDQQLVVSPKANIAAGGKIVNYSEEISQKTRRWVKKIMSDLSLRVGGIDVFVERTINDPDGFIVIEINQNPSLLGIYHLGYQHKVLAIWKKILRSYFGKV